MPAYRFLSLLQSATQKLPKSKLFTYIEVSFGNRLIQTAKSAKHIQIPVYKNHSPGMYCIVVNFEEYSTGGDVNGMKIWCQTA